MTGPEEKESFEALRNIFLSDVGAPEDHEATKIHTHAALFGQIAVNERIISQDQLKQGLEEQKNHPGKMIGKILMEKGILPLSELITILRAQRKVRPSPLGNIGPYFLLEELGRGGVGRVYHAVHEGLLKQVAIKILEPSREISEEMLKRFHREAMVAARLQHPNIVAVHDVGNIGEVHYIVMDYLEGVPLSSWLANEKRPLQDRLLLLHKIVKTVGEAHTQGVLHRDLKPENVIVRITGEPVLVDFGLARGTEDLQLTQSGMVMGTPLFMSPEQVQGEVDRVGVGSDIFSLGVMLYFATTGTYPFFSETPRKLYEMIVNKDPLPPTKVKEGLPSDMDIIILKCLEKDPNNRYPSAAILAEDLQNCAIGDPILATKVATMIRFWRRLCRRPSIFASAIIILILFTVGSTYFYFQNKTHNRLTYALQLNSTYGQLHPQISELMKEADTIRYRGGEEKEIARIISTVDQAVLESGDQTGMGEGYRGWIRFLLRNPDGPEILKAARKEYPKNPFLDLLLARTHLREYLDRAQWPDAGFTAEAVQVPYVSLEPEETKEMVQALKKARTLLQEARSSDIWKNMPALKWGIDLSEGFEAYSTNRLETSITHLQKLQSRPDLALEGAFFLILAYCRKGNPEAAIPIAQRLVDRRPDLVPAKNQLAACHQFLGAEYLTQNRDATPHLLAAKEIIQGLNQTIKSESRLAVLNLMLGISESRSGNIPKAKQYLMEGKESYERFLRRWPNSIRYRVNLARALIDLGSFEKETSKMALYFQKAGSQLNQALKIDPSNSFLAFCKLDNELNLSQISARKGTFSEKESKTLEKEIDALAKESESRDKILILKSKLFYSQGYRHYRSGNRDEARKALTISIQLNSEALKISPGMIGIQKDILNKSFLLAEWEKSEISRIMFLIKNAENLIQSDPQFAGLQFQLAKWLRKILPHYPEEDQRRIGELEIDSWKKVVAQNIEGDRSRLILGDSLRKQANRSTGKSKKVLLLNEAISVYSFIEKDSPDYSNSLRGISGGYLKLFRIEGENEIPPDEYLKKARLFVDQSILVSPTDIRGRELRLQILNSVLKPNSSLMKIDLAAGFDIDLDWKEGHYWKARIRFIEGNLEGSQIDLNSYLRLEPKSTLGYLLLAHIRLQQKDFSAAIKATLQVIKLEKDQLEAWMIRGYSLMYMGKNGEAIEVLEQARIYSVQQQNRKVTRAIDRTITDLER